MRFFDCINRIVGGLWWKCDYILLFWEDYFDSLRDVCVNDKNVFFVLLSVFVMREGEIFLNFIFMLIMSVVIV